MSNYFLMRLLWMGLGRSNRGGEGFVSEWAEFFTKKAIDDSDQTGEIGVIMRLSLIFIMSPLSSLFSNNAPS
jgi:hypothetical protein